MKKIISIICLLISGLMLHGCAAHTLQQKDAVSHDRKIILSENDKSAENDEFYLSEEMGDDQEIAVDEDALADEEATEDETAADEIAENNDLADTDEEVADDIADTADNEDIAEDDAPEGLSDEPEADSDDTEKERSSLEEIQPILDKASGFCELSQELWQKREIEKALGALDQAYALILSVDTDDPDFSQQKETLRFMISKRILEIHASRHVTAKGNHHAIPVIMNSHVQAEIDNLSPSNKDGFFIQSYKRAGKYRPYIVEELKKAGLPIELSWLPLIESGFTAHALSSARALGLWQFIPSTGYKFGLKRDKYVDERMDFEKATKAAIAYLKELHQIFGDWSTVLAAYNCGEGKVLRIIREQNVNYLDNFWDLYEKLPRETARYVPRFMATLHMISQPEKYGLDSILVCPELKYETVTISKQAHLKDIARIIDISPKTLKDLNPELRYNILPGENYSLRIPHKKGEILLANLDDVPDSSLSEITDASKNIQNTTRPHRQTATTPLYYKVRRGDTLSSIAGRYGTTVKNIVRANGITKKRRIVVGKTLKIPTKYTSEKYVKVRYRSYKVRRGDTLSSIAGRYGTTVRTIIRANGITKKRHIVIGRTLKIPTENLAGSTERYKHVRSMKTHVVKSGDSLWNIARRYGISTKAIHKLNNLKSTRLYIGQVLKIPARG